jgi:RimJ/RimL family protein N-acetyltransferase
VRQTPSIRLVRLTVRALESLVAGDVASASAEVGVPLSPYVAGETWLWRIRLDQVARTPADLAWVARLAVDDATGVMVGHVGFHGAPDGRGMVEVGYSVDPRHRRHGYGTALLAAALAWAAAEPGVDVVRASVAPDNEASLATLRPFSFTKVGEQWDEEDGLELVFERPVG